MAHEARIFAGIEANLRRERQLEGIASAKARGVFKDTLISRRLIASTEPRASGDHDDRRPGVRYLDLI
jgi:hypothetical protein